MQRCHNDLKRRFLAKFRVWVDRDAAPVVAHRDRAVRIELEIDKRRVSRDRLVHRVVEQFGDEMMHPGLVGAADVHAGASAHRFEAFEDLDILGGIIVGSGLCRRLKKVWHWSRTVFCGRGGDPPRDQSYGSRWRLGNNILCDFL